MEQKQNESRKNDKQDNKLRWELLPLELIEKVVEVYHFGAQKYAPNTWQNLPNGYERYKSAMLRHIVAYEKGETKDPESGLHPLAHAAWNALAMLHCATVNETERRVTPCPEDVKYKAGDTVWVELSNGDCVKFEL